MIRPLLLLACLCACPTLSARSTATAAPATATDARQALDAWLVAFNKGDRATWEACRQRYGSAMNIDNSLEFRDSIGGFVLARHEPAEGDAAVALLRELESDHHARLRVTLAPGPTARIDLAGVLTPPDLTPARLDAQAALDDVAAFADAASAKDAFAGALLIAQGDQVLLQGA